jgi:hypothetical protein
MQKFGWGEEGRSKFFLFSDEKREFDRLAEAAPDNVVRRQAKPVLNTWLHARVKQIQIDNGIEGGFCFLFLYQALFGRQPAWLPQLISSCVASGDMRTTLYRMLAEVFLLNDPETLAGTELDGRKSFAFFAPYNYRAGRREANIRGRKGGSLCLPHIRGKMKYGHLPCDTPGLVSDTYPEPQSENLYTTWGRNNRLLEQHRSSALPYLLLESEPINDIDSQRDTILEHFKPANICSNWAFKPDYQHPTWRDEFGDPVWIFTRDHDDDWQHNMSVVGFILVSGVWYVVIENSWGSVHKGRRWFCITADEYSSWVHHKSSVVQTVGEIDMADNTNKIFGEL